MDNTQGLPIYDFKALLTIAGLATQQMLRQDRRQLAKDQQATGQYWSGHAWILLYRAADAVDMPPLSPGRQRLYDKARTCADCGATRKDTHPRGRDGERYCGTCQGPAAERLWQRERAADRPAVAAWARSVLDDPTVIFGAREYEPDWTKNLIVDRNGQVLLDASIRHYITEPDPRHPYAEDLALMSPLAVIDQVTALRGRRLIAWEAHSAPELVTSFDDRGWPAAHAAQVASGDAFGRWLDRWLGDLEPNSSYLHHPRLKQQRAPRDPAECVALMRRLLPQMAELDDRP
ncbi:hypothetical protein [Actinoplanes sp. HUAS TT8]|uniref:hypothetical protein n=1 Tax=Actinoplanes sp. HUAS TT8 TaxID=3447453 RepID=UPI003F527B9F